MGESSLILPQDLDAELSQETSVTGLTRSEVIRRALSEYLQRRQRQRLINEYLQEARRGYADPALRDHALAAAEEAVAPGNEALERAETAASPKADAPWWR